MFDGLKRTSTGDFYDVATPHTFRAIELYEARFAAHHVPVGHWQLLNLADTDVAKDRDILRIHPEIVG